MSHGPAQITTVVTPAESSDLVDLTTVKTLLGVTDDSLDAYFKLVIPQASTAAQNECNRRFVPETVIDSFWPQRDGFPWVVRGEIAPLQLSRWPVIAVVSVVETIVGVPTTLVAGTDYLLDAEKGQLTRLDGNGYPCGWRANPIAATFSAGFDPIPPDVVDGVVRLVKLAYFARNRDPMLRSQASPGVYEAAYWFGNGPGNSGGLPPDIQGLFSNYRVPVFA